MSLSQLLAVGQSIKGGKDTPNPFRMRNDRVLPKFAPMGRPISLAPQPKPFSETAQMFFTARKAVPAGSVPSRPTAAPASAPQTSTGQKTAPRGLARLNPFAAKPVARRSLVQTEMSLDTVRVMRNDLKDADLELVAVPAVKAPETTAAEPKATIQKAETTVWNRLTGKLFRLSQAWH